jgi:hypothetical protein
MQYLNHEYETFTVLKKDLKNVAREETAHLATLKSKKYIS